MPWTSLPSLTLALALIGPARRDSVASDYLACLRELLALRPAVNRVAEVQQLTLRRDVGQLVFERGTIYELSPVGGRVVGLVFRGQGRFVFAPSHPTEQAELRRLGGPSALDDSFHEVILLVADSTLDQLRGLTFGPGAVPGDVGDVVQDALNSLKGNQPGAYASDVMGPLLNSETSGLFLAVIKRDRGEPVLFELNPALSESVQLRRPVSRNRWGAAWAADPFYNPNLCEHLDYRIARRTGGVLSCLEAGQDAACPTKGRSPYGSPTLPSGKAHLLGDGRPGPFG